MAACSRVCNGIWAGPASTSRPSAPGIPLRFFVNIVVEYEGRKEPTLRYCIFISPCSGGGPNQIEEWQNSTHGVFFLPLSSYQNSEAQKYRIAVAMIHGAHHRWKSWTNQGMVSAIPRQYRVLRFYLRLRNSRIKLFRKLLMSADYSLKWV